MNIGNTFNNVFGTVARTVPQIVVFILVLIIGWIIAKVLRKVVATLLDKAHFNRLTERGWLGRTMDRSEYTASGVVATLVYYAILLITLQLAFGVFGRNPISTLLTAIVAWIPRAIVAIILIVVAAAIGHALRNLIDAAIGELSYGRLLGIIVEIFVVALGVIAALNQVGIATTVTTPVLVAVLATIGAVIAIGVGGGLVRPMEQRWNRWLSDIERETSRRGAVGAARERGKEDALRGEGATAPSWEAEQRSQNR